MKASSNRNFGIVFFVFFLIISLFPLLKDNHINYWFFSISVVLLILGILNSKLLTPLNIIWFKLGILLTKIVSPVVMGLIFFIVITPISIIMKIIGIFLFWIRGRKRIRVVELNGQFNILIIRHLCSLMETDYRTKI